MKSWAGGGGGFAWKQNDFTCSYGNWTWVTTLLATFSRCLDQPLHSCLASFISFVFQSLRKRKKTQEALWSSCCICITPQWPKSAPDEWKKLISKHWSPLDHQVKQLPVSSKSRFCFPKPFICVILSKTVSAFKYILSVKALNIYATLRI